MLFFILSVVSILTNRMEYETSLESEKV